MQKVSINKDNVIQRYKSGESVIDISTSYNCGESTIRGILSLEENYNELKHLNKQNKHRPITINHICEYEGCQSITPGQNTKYCSVHQSIINNQQIIDEMEQYEIENTYIRKNNVFITYKNCNYFAIMIPTYNCFVVCDKKHYERIIKHAWHIHSSGYIEARIDKKVTLLHRFVLSEYRSDAQVDHKNGNKFDCREQNLRITNASQNQINKGIMSNNTSGITGVSWDKERNKWHVMISFNGKNINLGRYDTLEEAKQVRLEAEKKYHGEYSPIERRNYG